MKNVFTQIVATGILIALLWIPAQAVSQEYKISASGINRIEIPGSIGDLTIEGYSGNQIKIVAEKYKKPPKRAEGLQPLYSGGKDNSGIGLNVSQSKGVMKIVAASRSAAQGKYTMKIPENIALSIDYEIITGNQPIVISGMTGEVSVNSQVLTVKLEKITGPVVASSLSGDIVIDFSSLNQKSPMAISSISGNVDISMPASSKASFELKSLSGEIYTDLDIKQKEEKNSMRRMGGGYKIDGQLNGGGVKIAIELISGNVYLRKK